MPSHRGTIGETDANIEAVARIVALLGLRG